MSDKFNARKFGVAFMWLCILSTQAYQISGFFLADIDQERISHLFAALDTVTYSMIGVGLYLLLRKSVPGLHLGFIFLAAMFFADISFFETHLKNLFVDAGIVLPNWNPQWTKVYVFALLVALYLPLIFRKFRSIDRIFYAAMLVSVVTTTALFHAVTAEGALRDYEETQGQFISSLKGLGERDLGFMCHSMRVECYQGDYSEGFKDHVVNQLKGMEQRFISIYEYARDKEYLEHVYADSVGGNQLLFSRYQLFFLKESSPKARILVIIDKKNLLNFQVNQILYFGLLSIFAYNTWVIGGFGLLFWHKRKFKLHGNVVSTT